MTRIRQMAVLAVMMTMCSAASADPSDPDLIFRKSTTFKFLTPNDKLAVYGIDDPLVDGVACHYTTPEKGGLSGALGLAEQTSDVSLACRQYGPIKFKGTFAQGDVVFSERRSLLFKKMQIVRGCDTRRNILVYMTYSDKLIEGSPKNSTSTVPNSAVGRRRKRHSKMCRFRPLNPRRKPSESVLLFEPTRDEHARIRLSGQYQPNPSSRCQLLVELELGRPAESGRYPLCRRTAPSSAAMYHRAALASRPSADR